MKYESELIKEILEVRGHEKSSLHYESECVETWIKEYEGAYPKLCDYESEWLNYIVENPIGKFPYEIVTVNPTATINNVVPYAYKSAILSGKTLVNIPTTYNRKPLIGNIMVETTNLSMLKSNTKYLLKIINKSNYNITYYPNGSSFTGNDFTVNGKSEGYVILTSLDTTLTHNGIVRLRSSNETITDLECAILFIEYQNGMENWDLPYFEGMQSVKQPALTTSNEDGTKTNILTVNEPIELRGIGEVKDTLNCLTGELTQRVGEIVLDGSEKWKYSTQDTYAIFALYRTDYGELMNIKRGSKIVSDRYPNGTSENNIAGGNAYVIQIFKSLNVTLEEFKNELGTNPATVQFELATESVKTVDLTIINQDGETINKIKPIEGTMNFKVDGTPINPTAVLEVPVESITQNLASFIKG